jgi:hypothetical protein
VTQAISPDALDRAGLYAVMDRFLAALACKEPGGVEWAARVIYTENNVQLRVGDGLWNTVSAVRPTYDLRMADVAEGQVAWFGIIEEHGHPAIACFRLKVTDGAIAEAEAIVARSVANSPFPSIATYISPRAIMTDDVPPARRVRRARMISLSEGYFDTIQLNDGQIFTRFDPECDRVENGLQTTRNGAAFPDYPIAAFGCEDQFKLGQYAYDDRLRDRRFPLVDEEKGLVLAGGFIDHSGRLTHVTWTDGTVVESFYHSPHSYVLLEVFKIRDDMIAGVEAVFTDVPYNMVSPWIGPQPYVVGE